MSFIYYSYYCIFLSPSNSSCFALAYWEMGASEEVIEEASKGYTCLEKPIDKSGCLSRILDPKGPTGGEREMAQKQRKNPVTTGWSKTTHSRRRHGV